MLRLRRHTHENYDQTRAATLASRLVTVFLLSTRRSKPPSYFPSRNLHVTTIRRRHRLLAEVSRLLGQRSKLCLEKVRLNTQNVLEVLRTQQFVRKLKARSNAPLYASSKCFCLIHRTQRRSRYCFFYKLKIIGNLPMSLFNVVYHH